MYNPSLYSMLANAQVQELRRAAQTATYRRAAAGSNNGSARRGRRVTRPVWAPTGASQPPAYAPTECCHALPLG
jgi:hypothetical protein